MLRKTLEVDGVRKEDYWKVVDQCYLCDLCYMTKCPYVPPHPWNVDFPHVMLRAKAIKFKKAIKFRDRLLSSTDAHRQARRHPGGRADRQRREHETGRRSAMQAVLGVHKDRELPPYAPRKFRSTAESPKDFPVRDGKNTPGKVAIFSTCYVNYNEPGMGHDLLAILEHNEIPYVLVEQEACCGMPKLELGDLDGVDALKKKNCRCSRRYAREGYAILAPVPSCTLMFKQEIPLMYPDDADVVAVRDAMFDPFEYFVLRRKDGLLKTNFVNRWENLVSHPLPLARAEHGQKTRELLERFPAAEVTTVERCSGHDGTWGVKTEYFDNLDEDRPPGVPPDGRTRSCVRQLRLPDAARAHPAGMGDEAGDAEKAHRSRCCAKPTASASPVAGSARDRVRRSAACGR
jgi:Fe-S oxidoreductase